MRFRKLRIAWSVFWGLAAVLLIALWVVSCWRFDQFVVRASPGEYRALTNVRGAVVFGAWNDPILSTFFTREWSHLHFPMRGVSNKTGSPIPVFPLDVPESPILVWLRFESPFVSPVTTTNYSVTVPHWFLVIAAIAPAFLPWLTMWPTQFTLRTLLIATTLVAVLLGLIVWLH